ncbi:MAG: hypothetical protein J1G01_00650 [Clostridiales bacterium]|nr:hypothetical protein [Clostridiales bacterium]
MTVKKSGLNDTDKIIVAVALWLSAVALFTTALTLQMLPPRVAIFYKSVEKSTVQYYSKYNNLVLIFTSVIPATIILIAASLKKRNKLQNNFISVMLFSIMLSLCMGGVVIYGITMQFDSSAAAHRLNIHGMITLFSAFAMSMFCAVMPTFIHTPRLNNSTTSPQKARLMSVLDTHWNVGAYGFELCAVVCAFTPGLFCYIPLALSLIMYGVFLTVCCVKTNGVKKETELTEQDDKN